jgi:hypothetical protein
MAQLLEGVPYVGDRDDPVRNGSRSTLCSATMSSARANSSGR